MSLSLKEKIAKARAEFEGAEPTIVPVDLGGEPTEVSVYPVSGESWVTITATNPPRPGALLDENLGYNTDGAIAAYPVDRLKVDGEPVSGPDWADMVSALTAPARELLATTMWSINQADTARRLAEAGKALKGKTKS
jgi:hypothetical protein